MKTNLTEAGYTDELILCLLALFAASIALSIFGELTANDALEVAGGYAATTMFVALLWIGSKIR